MSKINAPYAVGHDQLKKIKTPAATRTWSPMPHHVLFETFAKVLNKRKFKLVDARHTLSHEGRRYFGVVNVKHDSDDFELSVGVRNSHDKFLSAGGVAGSRVIVCANLVFYGERRFEQRHTPRIGEDLTGQVEFIVDQLAADYSAQDTRFARYRQTPVTDAQAHDFLIRSIDRGVVAASDVPHVLKQWRTPDHPEFSADGKTMWRLFNAYTDLFKSVNLFDLPRRGEALAMLADKTCALSA